MIFSGASYGQLRRGSVERVFDIKLKGCELAVCLGGALLVGFLAAIAGGAFAT